MWPRYRACIFWNVCGGPFFFGFWIATAVHFIPCFIWTCDWGYYDGQGVRGGIWIGGTLIAWLGLMTWVCIVNKRESNSDRLLLMQKNKLIDDKKPGKLSSTDPTLIILE